MQLSILLVEDEPGIREGLASFMRLRGMRVTTAGSRKEGLAALAREDYDVVVTDWRLGDGLGVDIVKATDGPVVIASGVPEEVDIEEVDDRGGAGVCVIRKPVLPSELVRKLEEMAPACTNDQQPAPDLQLPTDAADRVRLLLAMAGDPAETEVIDDGNLVSVQVLLPAGASIEEHASALEGICSDFRILERDGRPLLSAWFYRDGRVDDHVVISPADPWPAGSTPLAIDFDRDVDCSPGCSPGRFLQLIARASKSRQVGRSVAFLNVPGHLRLYLEVLGRPHDMPKRGRAGPCLPEVLTELWS